MAIPPFINVVLKPDIFISRVITYWSLRRHRWSEWIHQEWRNWCVSAIYFTWYGEWYVSVAIIRSVQALQARECTHYAWFGTTSRSQVMKWFCREHRRSNNRIARSIKVYFCDFWLRKAIRCFAFTSWKLVYTNSPNIAHLSLIRWHAVLLSQLPQRYLLCMRRCIDIAVTCGLPESKGGRLSRIEQRC